MPFQGWDPEDDRPLAAKFRTKITVPATTTTFEVINGFGTVLALVMEETTGNAPARFELWDGTSTGGEYIGPWTLLASESFDNAYPPHGLYFRNGLFLNVTAGSVAGAIHIGTLVLWQQVYGGQD